VKNGMLEGFMGLRIVCYEGTDDVADWGIRKARLLRMAPQKE
jgi:hypothetical protein